MADPLDLIICSTCGTQHDTTTAPSSCKICDDPRQYLPPTGQAWTTLRTLQSTNTQHYHTEFTPDPSHPSTLLTLHTVPKVGIGQRAFLCRTPHGNVLWDCLTYLDADTVARIVELGGLAAIVISHPHFFGAQALWADTFACPVYISAEDRGWVLRASERMVFWGGRELVVPLSGEGAGAGGSDGNNDGDNDSKVGLGGGLEGDLVAVKTGGHFPGSAVLLFRSLRKLLVADSIGVVPSGVYHKDRVPGTVSYTFMWSYPNLIPLPPDEVYNIWKAVKHLEFDDIHGAFTTWNTHGNSKKRVLESAKIYIRAMGYLDHAIYQEECP